MVTLDYTGTGRMLEHPHLKYMLREAGSAKVTVWDSQTMQPSPTAQRCVPVGASLIGGTWLLV